MRKKKLTYAALALLTLGFAACQQKDDFAPQEQEQVLSIATRSTATEGTTEAFTRDFNLDLWNNDNPNKYERHGMHYDGTSWNVVKTNKLYDNTVAFATTGKGIKMDLDAVKNQYTLCVFDAQGTSPNVDDFDIMYAYNPNVDVKTPLDLEFKHLFTKLTFNIEYGSEFTVTARGTAATSEMSPAIGSRAVPDIIIENSTINAYRGGDNGISYADWIGAIREDDGTTPGIQCGNGYIKNTTVNKFMYNLTSIKPIEEGSVTYDADGNPTEQAAE